MRIERIIGVLIAILLLSGCVQQPAETPLPSPKPAPTFIPTPSPPARTPEPSAIPTPTPSPTPTPAPTPTPSPTPAPLNWTMALLLKDWLITPHDLAINDEMIYVSGNLDKRIVVLNLEGQILRYHVIEKNREFDNVCVGVNSQKQVFALSSEGLWELMPDGEAKKIRNLGWWVDHMTIGPDDGIYVSRKAGGMSTISRIGMDNTITDIVTVGSNRISDMEFDLTGDLFMADAQHGQILRYSQGRGLEIFSSGFGDGVFYLTFDETGLMYSSSSKNKLASVSTDGMITPLGVDVTGDLVFHKGLLYALNIYATTLYALEIDGTTVHTKRELLGGLVPWYIDHRGDVIVGARWAFSKRKFYNYYLDDPVRVEPNKILDELQPDQYTFDLQGNLYVLVRNMLKKIAPTGKEEFSVTLPGNLQWDTYLSYNPRDNKIYYFDRDSNSIVRASAQGTETYHKFTSKVERLFLTCTEKGKIYTSVIWSNGARILDISNPAEEVVIWDSYQKPWWFHIACDGKGNLYAAVGPRFQQVFTIVPTQGKNISMVPESPFRYEMGFVDPQGFTVTESGTVVLSAPSVLIKFSQR